MPNFMRVFIVSVSGAQKPQLWANFDFLGARLPTPFYRSGPNLVCQISPLSVYSVALCEKLNFLRFFWTSAFSGVASWQQSEKVEHGAQLQTFPYPTASQSFLYSNVFMAKSGAQSLTFKSVTNRQKTYQKLNVFGFGFPGSG